MFLPSATHLTASMLSGAHPTITYEGSAIFTQPYGLQNDGTIALGSIDLLRDMALLKGSEITAKAVESKGECRKRILGDIAPHVSFDLVIMNPPFARPTNHEGRHENVPNPMFAAFGSSDRRTEGDGQRGETMLTTGARSPMAMQVRLRFFLRLPTKNWQKTVCWLWSCRWLF